MRPLLYAIPLLVLAVQGPTRTATLSPGRFEALGACDVRPESVGCWNMDGAPAPELTAIGRTLFARGQEVRFQLGKKNRCLVVRRPVQTYTSYRFGEGSASSASTGGADSPYDFVRVAAEPSETRAVLRLTASAQSLAEGSIAFQEGTTMAFEGRRIEVGASALNDAGPAGPKSWTVVLGIEEPGENGPLWEFVPMDASGFPILYVDPQGRPLSPAKATSLEPAGGSGSGSGSAMGPSEPKLAPGAAKASFQLYGRSPTSERTPTSILVRSPRSASARFAKARPSWGRSR